MKVFAGSLYQRQAIDKARLLLRYIKMTLSELHWILLLVVAGSLSVGAVLDCARSQAEPAALQRSWREKALIYHENRQWRITCSARGVN